MCGITFVAGPGQALDAPAGVALPLTWADAQRHRGPDERGSLTAPLPGPTPGHLTLIVDRLALTGGAAGHQPLTLDDPKSGRAGRYWLAFNGQVTNFRSLAAALTLPEGHPGWRSDTAVVGAWLAHHGPEAGLTSLAGMFALIWVDHLAGTVTLARDRYGIKPLWYGPTGGGGWAITSERWATPTEQPTAEALTHLLAYRYLPWGHGADTGLTGPQPLPPGHVLTLPLGLWTKGGGGVMPKSYLLKTPAMAPTGEALGFVEALEVSVHAYLDQSGTDEPVGIMLSGGLDSTTIAALAAKHARERGQRLIALTLEGLGADTAGARRVARRLGIPLVTVPQPKGMDELSRCLTHLATEPVLDPGAYLTWLLAARAHAEGIRILLSGAGADEWLGGYRRHRAWWWAHPTHSPLPPWMRPMLGWIGGGRMRRAQATPDPLGRIDALAALPLWPGSPPPPSRDNGLPFVSVGSHNDPLQAMLAHERATYLAWEVLSITDRSTSAHGVETRLPYLTEAVGQAAADCLRGQNGRPGKKALAAYLDRQDLLGLLPMGKRGFGPLRLPNAALERAMALLSPGHPVLSSWLSAYAPLEAWERWLTNAGPVRGGYSLLALEAYASSMMSAPGRVAGG